MSTELSCWQGFWNFLCCGACYDDPQVQRQRQPLLKDQPQGTGVSHHRPPPVSTHDSYQRPPSDRTVGGLSIQQVEVQTGSHGTPDPVVEKRDEEKRRSPSSSPTLDHRGGGSSSVVVEVKERHEGERTGSRPLPNPDAFRTSTSPPKSSLLHVPHVDTPYVARHPVSLRDQTSLVEPSTPPNSSLDLQEAPNLQGTPASSPMSNKEKSPSKVVEVGQFMHATHHDTGGSGTESD